MHFYAHIKYTVKNACALQHSTTLALHHLYIYMVFALWHCARVLRIYGNGLSVTVLTRATRWCSISCCIIVRSFSLLLFTLIIMLSAAPHPLYAKNANIYWRYTCRLPVICYNNIKWVFFSVWLIAAAVCLGRRPDRAPCSGDFWSAYNVSTGRGVKAFVHCIVRNSRTLHPAQSTCTRSNNIYAQESTCHFGCILIVQVHRMYTAYNYGTLHHVVIVF